MTFLFEVGGDLSVALLRSRFCAEPVESRCRTQSVYFHIKIDGFAWEMCNVGIDTFGLLIIRDCFAPGLKRKLDPKNIKSYIPMLFTFHHIFFKFILYCLH